MKKCLALLLLVACLVPCRAWAVPTLAWKGAINYTPNQTSRVVSVPVGQSAAVGDELIVFLGIGGQSITITPPSSTGVTWSTYATSCGNAGGGEELCAFTGQVTGTQAASTTYTFTAASGINISDIWDVAGTNNQVDNLKVAQGTGGGTTMNLTPTLPTANDFVGALIINFNNVNFGSPTFSGGWTGTPTNANTVFNSGNGGGADFYNVQTVSGAQTLGVNWTTSTWADYVTVALKSGTGGGGGGTVNIFNCNSGFLHTTGSCGVAYIGEGAAAFKVTGTNNGSTPVISGTAMNLLPNATIHAALSMTYQTQVNIQNFNTTFTFVPNGYNTSLIIQNSNNNPSFNGSIFSAGAGCEADFFQSFSQAAPPNNLFAVELDSLSPLTAAGSFTGSSAQIYPATYSPCNPNLGTDMTGWTYVSTTKLSTSPVSFNTPPTTAITSTGDTYSATLAYDGTTLSLNLFDVTTGGSCPGASCYSKSWTTLPTEQGGGGINIPSLVGGNTAWVGIGTASNTASVADSLIRTWTYNVVTPAAPSGGGFIYVP